MSIDTKPLCEDLLHVLRTRLAAPEFMLRHRQTAKDFTRKRVLPFVVVVVFLLNPLKRATQDELDEFFNLEQRLAVAPRVVTKSAFTQARRKLRAEAFIELNRVQIEYFYRHFPVHRWHGLRLVAIDGSTAELSVSPDIVKYFMFDDRIDLSIVHKDVLHCLHQLLSNHVVHAQTGLTIKDQGQFDVDGIQ